MPIFSKLSLQKAFSPFFLSFFFFRLIPSRQLAEEMAIVKHRGKKLEKEDLQKFGKRGSLYFSLILRWEKENLSKNGSGSEVLDIQEFRGKEPD